MRFASLISILAAVLVAATATEIIGTDKDGVRVITAANLDDFLAANDVALLEFYAPSCARCKELKPEFARAARELSKFGLNLGKVDAAAETSLGQEFNVKGYPKLMLFIKGARVEDYEGENDWADIVDYVRKNADPEYVSPPSPMVTLTNSNFTDFVKDKRVMMIMFYAPWCQHCKDLMPVYEAAARSLDDWSIPLAKMDGTENKELADRFGAAGWPTLKVLNRGRVFDYGGSRDKASIVGAMKWHVRPASIELRGNGSAQLGNGVNVVGYFNGKSEMYASYMRAANEMRMIGFSFFHSLENNSTETERIVVHKRPILVTEHEEASHTLTDGTASFSDIVNFVKARSVPLVDHRTKGNPRNTKVPVIVVYFKADFGYHFAKDTTYIRDIVAEVANDYADAEVKFSIGDLTELAEEASSLGLGKSADDVRVACLADGGRKYIMPSLQDGEIFTADSLRKFIRDLKGGRVEPELKSEPVPVNQNETSSVRIVASKSYEEDVHKAVMDAVVFFHAAWCGHCQEFSPFFEELAAELRGELLFVKIDGTTNEAPAVFPQIQGFPSIFFVKVTDKTNPVKYIGDRSDKSLRKFIKENRTPKKKLEVITPNTFGSMNSAVNEFRRFFATSDIKDEL